MAIVPAFRFTAPRKVTLLRAAGKDAAKFLNNFCTNDITGLAMGQGCEAFSCDAKGRVLFHWTVAYIDNAYWVATHADVGERLWSHLDRYHFREELTLEDLSRSWSELILLGSPPEPVALNEACNSTQVSMYTAATISLENQTGWVQRLPIFGSQAFHLFGPNEWLHQVATSLVGRDSLVDDSELDRRRIAMGWPLAAVDYDDKTIPQELNRDAVAISFNKGCYLGQETVARLDALGQVQRKLVGFTFKAQLSETPFVVKQEEKDIATVSSWSHFSALNQYIGLGFARRSHFQPGCTLGSSDNLITVTSLPIMNDIEER
jgi:folate-binding protein YgfZ